MISGLLSTSSASVRSCLRRVLCNGSSCSRVDEVRLKSIGASADKCQGIAPAH